jgi:hypothetical protein
LVPWKSSLEVGGQDLPENQQLLESRGLFIIGQRDQPPQPQPKEDLEVAENSIDPGSLDLELEDTASSSIECSAESESEPMENSSICDPETIDCLPGPSKSSNVGKEIEGTSILASQKRKKNQEIRTYGDQSDVVQKRRNLPRKCKLDYYESESGLPSNEKLKKNSGTGKHFKNPKSAIGTKKLAKRKKYWECDKCGKKVGFKCDLITHLQTHNNHKKDFAGRFCGKAVKTSNYRQKHEQLHNASKVSCKICGNELKNRFSLHNHLRYVHSDEKPKCQICQKIFSSKKALCAHEREIHKL